jgi:hypothetical protein
MSNKQGTGWYWNAILLAAFGAVAVGVVWIVQRPRSASPDVAPAPYQQPQPPAAETPTAAVPNADVPVADSPHPFEAQDAQRLPPADPQPDLDLGQPKTLDGGKPWFVADISTAITATFHRTSGSKSVEITVATPGEEPTRFSVIKAGTEGRFSIRGARFFIQVLGIDWRRSRVDVVVRQGSVS